GYQKFSDAQGCGCTLSEFTNNSYVPQYYTPQVQYSNTQNTYLPQNTSSSLSQNCYNETNYVCGAPNNTCIGSNCAILQPRTYKNICQLEAVEAQFLAYGECQTYNRTHYNTYASQNYRNNYSATDEDYLMYLVSEFIYDLERQNYSDSKMVTTIERVITRLENLGDTQSSFRSATRSAIFELEDYKERFETRDAYREIENIFDRY
ncbi:hypothetical protein N9J72_02110, partial [Candidatus Gracilibacteria bacterium]|nr:hypothetical protein [Candidatus Gracilibacteria bacterium]